MRKMELSTVSSSTWSERDHVDMINHVLKKAGPNRLFKYPKVVIKQPKHDLESCYTYGEWLERRKRKHVVLMESLPSCRYIRCR